MVCINAKLKDDHDRFSLETTGFWGAQQSQPSAVSGRDPNPSKSSTCPGHAPTALDMSLPIAWAAEGCTIRMDPAMLSPSATFRSRCAGGEVGCRHAPHISSLVPSDGGSPS